MDDDIPALGEVNSQSPQSNDTHSPRSDDHPAPIWTAEMERAATEAHDIEQADIYIYDLMRLLASCTRLLAMYECEAFAVEIDMVPRCHQETASILTMIARAKYEEADYMRASFFCVEVTSNSVHNTHA